MKYLAAIQTKLETLGGLAARFQQHRVALAAAAELLHWHILDVRAAAGTGPATAAAAGGAEALKAAGAGFQQTKEQHGALTPQACQQQLETRAYRGRRKESFVMFHQTQGLTTLLTLN